jgi:predicted RND superfamily exporter protein
VHLATSLRRHYGEHPTREGVETSVQEVGAALVVTSLTAAVGFLSLAIARFLPIRYFGLLSASAMIVALGAGLIVLPALLSLRYHRNERFTRSTS